MRLGPNAARIMGILGQGETLPSDLRARHDFSEPTVPTDAPPEFRGPISEVQNIEQGIRELEGRGLAAFFRTEAGVKVLRAT